MQTLLMGMQWVTAVKQTALGAFMWGAWDPGVGAALMFAVGVPVGRGCVGREGPWAPEPLREGPYLRFMDEGPKSREGSRCPRAHSWLVQQFRLQPSPVTAGPREGPRHCVQRP